MIEAYRAKKRSMGSRTSILIGRVRYFSIMIGMVFIFSSASAWTAQSRVSIRILLARS